MTGELGCSHLSLYKFVLLKREIYKGRLTMYFNDVLKLKREGDRVVFSFRVTENKVEEHYIPLEKMVGVFENLEEDVWGGHSVIQIKIKGATVWFKFHTNVYRADIYSVPLSEFRLLKVRYQNLLGE